MAETPYLCGMEEKMQQFYKASLEGGLCDRYSQLWQSAHSKRQLMDIALDANGVSFVAEAVADGSFLTEEYIAKEFEHFLNGQYVRKNGQGYTSALYLGKNDITIQYALNLIIGCKGTLFITRPCEIHLVNSNVQIYGLSFPSKVYLYKSEADTTSAPDCKIMKQ